MKERILFVTNGSDNYQEGFPYALYLAKTLNSGIAILMIHNKQIMETCEDVFTSVVFAEAGEFETAKEILQMKEKETKAAAEKRFQELSEKYRETSVDLICQAVTGEVLPAIKDFLKKNPNIDMVLLSPSISNPGKGREVKKLIKNISKPIITITSANPLQANA